VAVGRCQLPLAIVAFGDGGPWQGSHRGRAGRATLGAAAGLVGVVIVLGPTGVSSAATSAPTLSIFAGDGAAGPATPGPATTTGVGYDNFGMAVDASGNTYVVDDGSDEVYRVTPGGVLSVVAGDGTDTAPTPGPATSSSIGDPEGLALDAAGDLYIADSANSYVYKITPGGLLSIFAGDGESGPPTPGLSTQSAIGGVDGLAIDPSGNLFVVSYSARQVFEVSPAGNLNVFAGVYDVAGPPTVGPATASSLGNPQGIATDLTFRTSRDRYLPPFSVSWATCRRWLGREVGRAPAVAAD
jgi:secreted PhoX family phosphatase